MRERAAVTGTDREQSRPSRATGPRKRRGASGLLPSGFMWILPALIISVGLIYYSIAYSGFLSFFSWGGGRQHLKPVGLDNYTEIFSDPVFWMAIRNTVIYFVVVFTVQVIGGVLFAAAMHSRVIMANVYKVIIVIPIVVAPATMAPAHIQVWQSDGTLNRILEAIGLGDLAQSWIGQSTTSLLVVILVGCWGSIGFGFILYFGAMTQIDPEMLEAGRIDGAGNFRILFSLVLPNVRSITISLAILNLITALKLFDSVWLITQGGPAHSSEFLGTMIYSETSGASRDLGYASALSIILMLIAVATSIIVQRSSRERAAARPRRGRRAVSEERNV
ncbi:sugar ABC transporter permease [Mycetocola tolaasinivorans]|uniref:Sugar ABC transporter permease n=2 Tax=Mycetocola tolaasinivorans TaxID=76635 RepID=A0A3L7AA43_9MICO|nr:sugar ABC transporter permease [Mycetocola tolaasinivorans]